MPCNIKDCLSAIEPLSTPTGSHLSEGNGSVTGFGFCVSVTQKRRFSSAEYWAMYCGLTSNRQAPLNVVALIS
jgi:hypothetical protein